MIRVVDKRDPLDNIHSLIYTIFMCHVFCDVRMYLLGIVYHNGPAADSGVDVG